jgi:hypothetical protein
MVRLFRVRDGMKQELAVMEKGDFFGELAVLEGLARTTHAEAIGDVEVIEINSATFDRMIRANIEIAVRMLRKQSNRLQEANSRLEAMTQTSASARLEAPPAAVDLDAPAPPPPPEPEPEPVAPRADAASAASAAPVPAGGIETRIPEGALGILILEGGGKIFTLRDPSAVIGRYDPVTGTRPEIDLTQYDINRSVSRRHARLAMQDGSYHLIEEVGALNGTLVNGRRLTPGKPQALVSGDRIALGMVKLVFQAAGLK